MTGESGYVKVCFFEARHRLEYTDARWPVWICSNSVFPTSCGKLSNFVRRRAVLSGGVSSTREKKKKHGGRGKKYGDEEKSIGGASTGRS